MIGDGLGRGLGRESCLRSIIWTTPPTCFLKGLCRRGMSCSCLLEAHSFSRQCFKDWKYVLSHVECEYGGVGGKHYGELSTF